jgi:peroxiredoxin (alkyl hydroperoxide reductase subunit C)
VCWPNILPLLTLKTFHGAKTHERPSDPYPPLTLPSPNHQNKPQHPPKQAIPLPRTSAPDFTATAVLHDDFTSVSLSDYTSKSQWLVLFFYPFDYTFVCPTEIRSFSDAAGKFADINVGVAAVSTDR